MLAQDRLFQVELYCALIENEETKELATILLAWISKEKVLAHAEYELLKSSLYENFFIKMYNNPYLISSFKNRF